MRIDWSRVSALHDDFGDDAFAEILDVFVEEAAEALQRLEAAQTHAALRDEFHFLKGAALNMGLAAMADICAEGETCARNAADCADHRDKVLTGFLVDCKTLSATWRDHLGGQ